MEISPELMGLACSSLLILNKVLPACLPACFMLPRTYSDQLDEKLF
jgi:hypothetical protein